jgi:hypothetical protein
MLRREQLVETNLGALDDVLLELTSGFKSR